MFHCRAFAIALVVVHAYNWHFPDKWHYRRIRNPRIRRIHSIPNGGIERARIDRRTCKIATIVKLPHWTDWLRFPVRVSHISTWRA